MKEGKNGKITLPKELQREMLKFFMKTSIPRRKQAKSRGDSCAFSDENATLERQKIRLLSEEKADKRSDEK